MEDILDVKSSSMAIDTYGAIQTVKYYLKTRQTTAIKFFARDDVLYSKVDGNLCRNIKSASSCYRSQLQEKHI